MKTLIATLCLVGLMITPAQGILAAGTVMGDSHPTHQPILLQGRLINTKGARSEPFPGPVNLKLRLYSRPDQNEPLAQQFFDEVPLDDGVFRLAVDTAALPHSETLFVEVAMRPRARKYAEYRVMPPRQAIRLPTANSLFASLEQPLLYPGPDQLSPPLISHLSLLEERKP